MVLNGTDRPCIAHNVPGYEQVEGALSPSLGVHRHHDLGIGPLCLSCHGYLLLVPSTSGSSTRSSVVLDDKRSKEEGRMTVCCIEGEWGKWGKEALFLPSFLPSFSLVFFLATCSSSSFTHSLRIYPEMLHRKVSYCLSMAVELTILDRPLSPVDPLSHRAPRHLGGRNQRASAADAVSCRIMSRSPQADRAGAKTQRLSSKKRLTSCIATTT